MKGYIVENDDESVLCIGFYPKNRLLEEEDIEEIDIDDSDGGDFVFCDGDYWFTSELEAVQRGSETVYPEDDLTVIRDRDEFDEWCSDNL